MPLDKLTITTELFPCISAASYGSGKEAILLLHGFPATGRLWRHVIPLLAERYRVIVPDLPGTGDSLPATAPVSIAQLAEGMAELIDRLDIGPVHVAGHSMGGYIGLALAANSPGRLAGLSLVHSTAFADDEEKKANRRKAIALIGKGAKDTFVRNNIPTLFSPAYREAHPDVVAEQTQDGLTIPAETLIAFYEAMIERPERLDLLRETALPVQWIIGGQDSVVPLEKSLQQGSLSRVSFVNIYKDAGHVSMLEHPRELAKDLEAFTVYCYSRQRKTD